uniref:Uncharacterized protein n=1 Tax=Oryza rufipogon TaxID=4529 RepID=A0A0E0QEQ1_ORYRU
MEEVMLAHTNASCEFSIILDARLPPLPHYRRNPTRTTRDHWNFRGPPIVQCQTLKYNMKSRAGRGFILEVLKVMLVIPLPRSLPLPPRSRVINYMPIARGEKRSVEAVKVTDEMKAFKA